MKISLDTFPRLSRRLAIIVAFSLVLGTSAFAEMRTSWRAATPAELEEALPGRALVGQERIETEMRTATGIVDDQGHVIAAVVLITAGYAADGKYSHYLLVQAPILISEHSLAAGTYVVGWSRVEEGLAVHIFDAASGTERITLVAKPIAGPHRVESFRIWPPSEHSMIQIGRYMLPYAIPSR
jgi:hypothetical protein